MSQDVQKKRGKMFISIRLKMLVALTLLFTVVFSIAFYWFYTFATNLALEGVYSDLTATAETAAAGIDGDMHQALYENPEYEEGDEWPAGMTDERFWDIAEWLFLVQQSNRRAFPYTYVSPEPGVVEFIVSSGAAADPPVGAPFGARYEPQPPSVILQGLEEPTLSTNIVQDEYGAWVSGFVPIRNSSGEIVAAVGVDYLADNVIALQDQIKAAVLPAFALTYSVLFGAVWVISNGVTAPIRALSSVATRIGEGHYEVAEEKDARFPDEVDNLTQIFNVMVRKVQQREQKLRERVQELEIIIDEGKRSKQVSEITDSEFFRDLQERARKMRARNEEEEGEGS